MTSVFIGNTALRESTSVLTGVDEQDYQHPPAVDWLPS
jgi:hypothetical protein